MREVIDTTERSLVATIHALRSALERLTQERDAAVAKCVWFNRLLHRIDMELTDGEQGPSETIVKIAEKIEEWGRSDDTTSQPLLDRLAAAENVVKATRFEHNEAVPECSICQALSAYRKAAASGSGGSSE